MKTHNKKNISGISAIAYIIGIALFLLIIFFAFKRIGSKSTTETSAPKSTAQEILITIEGTLGQTVAGADAFYITTNAGFMTLSYSQETAFVDEEGKQTDVSALKPGAKIRAEGRPSGSTFEAKKVALVKESPKTRPTSSALPATGITE